MSDVTVEAPVIQPQPLPCLVTTTQLDTPQGPLLMLTWTTPGGSNHYFLTPDSAVQLGEKLVNIGRASASGLTVVER